MRRVWLAMMAMASVSGTMPGQTTAQTTVRLAKPPKVHVVSFGVARKVPYTPADAAAEDVSDETHSLRVRALIIDERQREWTMGEIHEVTDRSFTVRRVMRLNDALPGAFGREGESHWAWQPGPWLLVDRVTGHITALHLPDFDAEVSNAVWYRDYAAYCGIATTAKGGLFAIVAQLSARKAVVQKQIGPWPQANHFVPVCAPAEWQKAPMRVTLKVTGGDAVTFDVVGTTALVEEGDSEP